MAPAVSFMYLSSTVALTVGVPISNAVTQAVVRRSLGRRLPALGLGAAEVREVCSLLLLTLLGIHSHES